MAYKQKQSTEQQVVEGIFRGIASLFKMIFGRGVKGLSAIDRAELAAHFEMIYGMVDNSPEKALMEADKLIYFVLDKKNVSGASVGEKLKNARDVFLPMHYNNIWEAHKLRNTIAHEIGHQVNVDIVRRAINNLEKGLKSV